MNETDNGYRERRRRMGAILIVVGFLLFALQITRGPASVIVFLVFGGAFIAGYFRNRSYGLLVPGCLLLGLALSALGKRSSIDFHDFDSFGLGLGFVAIFIIDTLYRGRSHWWPLIPGGALLITSVADSRTMRVIVQGWPLLLVVIGASIFFRSRTGPRPRAGGDRGAPGDSSTGAKDAASGRPDGDG
jgi:hypothetical protein